MRRGDDDLLHLPTDHAYYAQVKGGVFQGQEWTLFIIRLRFLFYFVFRTRSTCFRNIYQLQMVLGV